VSLEWVNKPEPNNFEKPVKRENPSIRHYNFKLLGDSDKIAAPTLTTTTTTATNKNKPLVISSLPPKDGRSIQLSSSGNHNSELISSQSHQNTNPELNDNKLVNPFSLSEAKTSAVFVATPAFTTTTTTTTPRNLVKVSSLPPGASSTNIRVTSKKLNNFTRIIFGLSNF
jgi:hypothetical protein